VPSGNVNTVAIEFAYRFGHYRQTSSGDHGKLSPQHIASAPVEYGFKDGQYS
jgi:hypothetical protein